jgi:hypothetical protein
MKAIKVNLQEASPVLARHRQDDTPAIRDAVRTLLADQWREQAIQQYFAAYQGAIAKDLKITQKPMRGLQTLVAFEGGTGFVRLIKARGVSGPDEAKRLAAVENDLKTLEHKPENGAITPIIFPLDHNRSLGSLLAPNRSVGFDLDGTHRPQRWSWVQPDTGILVWDPSGRGRIDSGRQLFGSVTWWMFFPDGYRALEALDDNRDGVLSGCELRGLSVWIDRNGDGVSDMGEVLPVSAAGISAISVRSFRQDDGSPCNPAGLLMSDGRVLPTFDWTTSPLPDSASSDVPLTPPG